MASGRATRYKKKGPFGPFFLYRVARPEGFEPPTTWFVVIQPSADSGEVDHPFRSKPIT